MLMFRVTSSRRTIIFPIQPEQPVLTGHNTSNESDARRSIVDRLALSMFPQNVTTRIAHANFSSSTCDFFLFADQKFLSIDAINSLLMYHEDLIHQEAFV
jgi:hypothetical protein